MIELIVAITLFRHINSILLFFYQCSVGLLWLSFFITFGFADQVLLENFFQKRGYELQIEDKRETYQHDKELFWEFQTFNKLFKVNKYVYFFKQLPILKNNRIRITQEDFDFLKKVVKYYEERKNIHQKNDNNKEPSHNTTEKQSTEGEEKIPSDNNSPPKKNLTNNLRTRSNKQSFPSSLEKVKDSSMEGNTIDDLYSVDKLYKIDYVFLDPGHGGKDPGATFYGYVEKDLTLSLSQELAKILREATSDFKVVLTRNDDTYLSLGERCTIANETLKPNENGIFISVHLNVWVDPEVRGIEVFYLSGNDKVIQRKTYRHLEDLVGAQEGYFKKIFSYLKVIQYQIESRFLSYLIIKNIESNIKASIPRGYKEESFYILKGVLMPSVLLELGFLSNREDIKLLNEKDKRNKILKQISTAVINYTKEFEKSNGFRDDYYFDKFLSLE